MNVLALDTTTEALALAAASPSVRVWSILEQGLRHGAELAPAIARLLDQADVKAPDLDLLVVGIGPGSFTGVRIGLALAKGMAAAGKAQLVGVSGLDALARRLAHHPGPVVPVVDGRKGRVYTAVYQAGRRVGDYRDLPPAELGALLPFPLELPPPLLTGPAATQVGELIPATDESPGWFVDEASPAVAIVELLELGLTARSEPRGDVRPLYLRKSEAELGIAGPS